MSAATLRLILGDQLNASHSWFSETRDDVLYLIAELKQETGYVRHHGQKICAFFAAMGAFARALEQAGHRVLHLTLDDTAKDKDLPALLARLFDQHRCQRFEYQRPDEWRLLAQLRALDFCPPDAIQEYDTEHFLLPFDEIPKQFRAGKHVRMEAFYRRMRKRFGVLMNGDRPRGDQWNYDQDNRQSLKAGDLADIPEPLVFANDVSAIIERLDRHQVDYFGHTPAQLLWPVNRQQAKELLAHFCEYCLPDFGRFQDAMTVNSEHRWSLYHSRISFALNAKILSPWQVMQAALQAFVERPEEINLAQIEGFVRQILGWREYVRGIYWANMPDYASRNHLEANTALPKWFWTGDTRMHCMQQAIGQSLEYAYAHHIQRLMVTGNFAMLAGIDPGAVDAWYLGIYIDAIEWVEMPNTRGMSQFADGGLIATKPYAASGSYINRMSDYCKNCHYDVKQKTSDNACPLNSLYWDFMMRHEERFSGNPRMAFPYKNLQKMAPGERNAIAAHAEQIKANIESL